MPPTKDVVIVTYSKMWKRLLLGGPGGGNEGLCRPCTEKRHSKPVPDKNGTLSHLSLGKPDKRNFAGFVNKRYDIGLLKIYKI